VVALGAGPPDVRGTSGCPSPEEVAQRLRPLLSADNDLPPGAWLEIAAPPAGDPAAGQEIDVRVMTGTPPRVLGGRRLSVPRSCDQAAQAVAVVAATWTATYRSPPPLWSGEAIDGPRADVAQASERPSLQVPRPPEAAVVRELRGDVGPSALAVGVSLGLAAATAGSAAPFLTAEVDLRGGGAFSARVLATGVGARTMALGSGQVAWRRLTAGAGVAHAWGTRGANLQIGGDVLAGAVFIDGRGFAQNAGTTSFDLGAGPWVRAGAQLAAAPVTVWVGAQGLGWARGQGVRVTGVESRDTLPRLDLLVGVGLAWNPPRP